VEVEGHGVDREVARMTEHANKVRPADVMMALTRYTWQSYIKLGGSKIVDAGAICGRRLNRIEVFFSTTSLPNEVLIYH
jgi:hypothetical protein